jgi:uncharacterized SAM-binding protein YcdF (DUF218 family)
MKLVDSRHPPRSAQVRDRSRIIRRWPGVVISASLLLCLAASGYVWRTRILTLVGYSIIDSEAPRHSDLILVLGGDFWGPRVVKGADLAVQGYSTAVLISGPPYNQQPEGELAVNFLVSRGYPRSLFAVFAHHADSTVGEALALAGELKSRGVKQVILVTSAYHSRRAAIVLGLFCSGVRFISVPAADPHYLPEQWWRNENYRRVFVSEWSKILGSVLFEYPKYLLFR